MHLKRPSCPVHREAFALIDVNNGTYSLVFTHAQHRGVETPKHQTTCPLRKTRAGGDETVRTRVFDMASAARPIEPIEWPEPYDSSGVARNAFTSRWHTHEEQLEKELSARCGVVCIRAVLFCLSHRDSCVRRGR